MPNRWLSLPGLLLSIAALGGCTAGETDPPTTATTPPTTAPEPASTTAPLSIGCSAADLPGLPGARPDLPDLVAARRDEIVAAAVHCDYDALAEMAAPDFTFSFGDGDDRAAFWRAAEEARDDPMRRLVLTLDLPSALATRTDIAHYIWPSAAASDSWEQVPEEDRDALLALYDAEDLALFAVFGGFVGERVGITPEGDWLFFVGGD